LKDKIHSHHRFYTPPESIIDDRVSFPGSESQHMLTSLRVRQGQTVTATDGMGKVYEIIIDQAESGVVAGRIIESSTIEAPGISVVIFHGIVRPSRMDFMVEKCTELGARGFFPVLTGRSRGGLSPKRRERLNRIAIEALKQSQGSYLPEVHDATSLQDALSLASQSDQVLVAWEGEREMTIDKALEKATQKIALWIGPEGGFTDAELSALKRLGGVGFSLGPLRLKTETAAIASTALILAERLLPGSA
jgi:16S rRNA (uracil1498-N3)-methyltransferase